jgi:manganese/zinc/iron transport system permease protein
VKDDAALAIVLSVFFGLGVALTGVIQQMPTGNAAGLKNYIYGKAAAMTEADARLILAASLGVAVVCAALFKEFRLLCFDPVYARAQGWPVLALDLVLMGLVVAVTVIGLQAVGLLLVVALLILPPAAARFWSHRLGVTLAVSTLLGAASGFAGVAGSALFPKLPAGAVIVLAAALAFAVSLALGTERGLLVRWLDQHRVSRRVERQHLLRALYEWCEGRPGGALDEAVPLAALREVNHWSEARCAGLLRAGRRAGLVVADEAGTTCRLTGQGRLEARRVTRNHRLWETYLLHYADVAPQHIHHNADDIEHVVEPDIVNRLEELLAGRVGVGLVPAEPEGGRARGAGRA